MAPNIGNIAIIIFVSMVGALVIDRKVKNKIDGWLVPYLFISLSPAAALMKGVVPFVFTTSGLMAMMLFYVANDERNRISVRGKVVLGGSVILVGLIMALIADPIYWVAVGGGILILALSYLFTWLYRRLEEKNQSQDSN